MVICVTPMMNWPGCTLPLAPCQLGRDGERGIYSDQVLGGTVERLSQLGMVLFCKDVVCCVI